MRNIIIRLLLPCFLFAFILSTPLMHSFGAEDISSFEKKLSSAEKLLQDDNTRAQGLDQLASIAKLAKGKKQDDKFVAGCEALAILSRISRCAFGYEPKQSAPLKAISKGTSKTTDEKYFKDLKRDLASFEEFSTVSDWTYGKTNLKTYFNPKLLPFIELAYFKATDKEQSDGLKQGLKMLTYAESHTEGIDQAETLCQWGELLRNLKEFRRSETYLNKALEYGNKWFKPQEVSLAEKAEKVPGTENWNRLKKRINDLLFVLSFDLLEENFGEAYAAYVKMRAFYDKEDWYHAFPLSIELKDKFPETVYGEAGRFYWCRMLLGNDMAEEMGDKSLPSGVKELEKFISDNPYGLYRGEAWMELGRHFLEYKWDEKKSAFYYNKALEWFRAVRDQKNLIGLYALPDNVKAVAAPRGPISSLDEWKLTKYRKPDIKEVINHQTAPEWYISENEKNCLFMVGFFFFIDGKYDEAKKYFEQVKEVDPNVAKLIGLNWPNVYWRLISACNVKYMLFPAKNKEYLKGRNKLRIALGELDFICEKFQDAKALFNDVLNDPTSSNDEKSVARIGRAACMDFEWPGLKEHKKAQIEECDMALKLTKSNSIQATALHHKAIVYMSVNWPGADGEAQKCIRECLQISPDCVFSEELQFHEIRINLKLGQRSSSEKLFEKFKKEYPDSRFTINLLSFFGGKVSNTEAKN